MQLDFPHYLSVKGENQLTENQPRLQQPTAMEAKVQTKNKYTEMGNCSCKDLILDSWGFKSHVDFGGIFDLSL